MTKLKDDPQMIVKVKQIFEDVLASLMEQDVENTTEYIEWLKRKTELRYGPEIQHSFFILNNCIYWANLGQNIGSEQDKHRPVLIVRTESKSTVCVVIPLTEERLNDGFWYHIDLEKLNSTALVEQLRVISKRRIDKPKRASGKIVSITENDWLSINNELKRLYTLKLLKKNQ